MFILESIDIFLFSKIVKNNIGRKYYLHKYILRHILKKIYFWPFKKNISINLFIY